MIPVRRKTFKTPKIQRISVRSWEAGTVTAFDDRRTPLKGLRHSENLILEQNGIIMPRPGTVTYGPPLLGKILGENFEVRAMSPTGPINWLINLQNVAGVTNAYVAKGEDATWTRIEGKTYDNEAPGHFLQVANKVLVMNGKDHLSFLDIPEMEITAFTAIADPVAGLFAEQVSDALGGCARCQPAREHEEDLATPKPGRIEQRGGNERGLAGAGRGDEHGIGTIGETGQQRRQDVEDRKPRRREVGRLAVSRRAGWQTRRSR